MSYIGGSALRLSVETVTSLAIKGKHRCRLKVTAETVSRVEQDEIGPRGPQPVTIEAIKRLYQE